MMKGIVITKNADLFTVESDGKTFQVKPSGKTKASGIFVGDYVEFGEVITKVLERKNLLIRPPVANIDRMFIVIAPLPKPDLTLVDKLLIYCHLNNILPIIVVNKSDILDERNRQLLERCYSKIYKVIFVSAKNDNLSSLKKEISGITVLAGQSAVGKSSIINSLFEGNINTEIGHLSSKVMRGKQTTRIVKLYKINDGYIADTAGFSLLDLSMVAEINERELSSYFHEFLEGRGKCKYRSCLHEGGECGVIEGVKNGNISRERYESYLKILAEIKASKKY